MRYINLRLLTYLLTYTFTACLSQVGSAKVNVSAFTRSCCRYSISSWSSWLISFSAARPLSATAYSCGPILVMTFCGNADCRSFIANSDIQQTSYSSCPSPLPAALAFMRIEDSVQFRSAVVQCRVLAAWSSVWYSVVGCMVSSSRAIQCSHQKNCHCHDGPCRSRRTQSRCRSSSRSSRGHRWSRKLELERLQCYRDTTVDNRPAHQRSRAAHRRLFSADHLSPTYTTDKTTRHYSTTTYTN